MIAKTFTALTNSNLDNGTTTFAVTMLYQATTAEPRTIRLVGGNIFDPYGTQDTKVIPGRRDVRYVFSGASESALHTHINTLLVDDLGKKGTLTFDGQDSDTYSQTAALRAVRWRPLVDITENVTAEITLSVEEITILERD
jgi:hypothetical protein